MLGRAAPIAGLLLLVTLPVRAQSMLVLRNGEVLTGQVSRQGDKFVVVSPGAEARISARDADFACDSLDEAYRTFQARAQPGRIEDRLRLADWCLKHELLGYAARELMAALAIDPRDRHVALLDRRLEEAAARAAAQRLAAPVASDGDAARTEKAPAKVVTGEDLDRMVRSLPPGTVETFTAHIQPLLLNHCANAACHGFGGKSEFTLLRPSLDRNVPQRLTQRNLHAALAWIDFDKPAESAMLVAAASPHAGKSAIFSANDSKQYRELALWVVTLSQQRVATKVETATPANAPPNAIIPASHFGPVEMSPSVPSVPASAPKLTLPPPPDEE